VRFTFYLPLGLTITFRSTLFGLLRAGVWWGVPVQPLDEYKRQNALVKSLPRLREEIKELKKQITELKIKSD
jgi:UDP-3-O-[3-hydroxymyristoyl] glucosamine N-acyltransferase